MDQLKYSLGPYEFLSSIVGGGATLLALYALYRPIYSVSRLLVQVKDSSSITIVVTLAIFSYLIGGLITGASWDIFLLVCKFLKKDYYYYGNEIAKRKDGLFNLADDVNIETLSFEDRLTLLLIRHIGIPEKFDSIDERLMVYLRSKNSQSAIIADTYRANHIMYRNLSFGFFLLSLISTVNIFRLHQFTFDQVALPVFSILIAYASFLRAVGFKRWHNREIMLGFYFNTLNK